MKETKGFQRKGLLLAAVLVMALAVIAAPGEAATIYVDINNSSGVEDGTETNPFNTIQEGINAASLEDTVKVASGTYYENLTINGVNIRLIGEDPKTTIIHGATNHVITISGTFSAGYELVEITGFSITGGTTSGIYLNSGTVITRIHNNIIFGNVSGVYARTNYTVAYILNNVIANNSDYGIRDYDNVTYSKQLSISNNIIVQNGTNGIISWEAGCFASYNNVWNNGVNYAGSINQIGNISENPLFVEAGTGDYSLASASPSIDAGQPLAADNDPDGTRNDQGVYGGPGSVDFWPYTAGGPVVTNLSVTPPSVPVGGTLTLKATGKIPE